MKNFCFTVDDNIRCFKEITADGCDSIFEHPYLSMYRRLHERYSLKVQLNLFYETDGFDLSMMTARHTEEWSTNSDWLKLSFHSRLENVSPYQHSGYDEVFGDCQRVHREICRFASPAALGATTTVHYCFATGNGLLALKDNGIKGLLGLYGTEQNPICSYQSTPEECRRIREGKVVLSDGLGYAGIDIILNKYSKEEILSRLDGLVCRELVKVMIHEQYFYPDYPRYQSDFEEKLDATFEYLTRNGFGSIFFEETLL